MYRRSGLQIFKFVFGVDGVGAAVQDKGKVPVVFQLFSAPPCESED